MSSTRTLPASIFSGSKSQIRLSDQQRKVLSIIQIDGEQSVVQMARRARLSASAVRRSLDQLLERGIVHRRTVINPFAMGFTMYGILLRCSGRAYDQREDLISFLVDSPKVSYVGEIGGAFALRIGIVTRTHQQNTNFFDSLVAKFGDFLEERNVLTVQGLIDYPLQCLGVSSNVKPLAIRSHAIVQEADAVDHAILRKLSEVGNRSMAQIGREIGVPSTTVEYRVARMRQREIIVGTRYLIDVSKFGFSSFVQFVRIRGCGHVARQRMLEFCHRHPNIYYSVHFNGNWDFEIGTVVENAADIVGVTNGLSAAFKDDLVAVETLPLLRYYKVSNFP